VYILYSDCPLKTRYDTIGNIKKHPRQNTKVGDRLESRGKQLVIKHLVAPMLEQRENYIGVELEYPLIPAQAGLDPAMAADRFMQYMIKEHGCQMLISGNNGTPVRIETADHDRLSFDFHYGQLEFSMWRCHSLPEIASRFFVLYQLANGFFSREGFILSGMGTNPLWRAADVSLVCDAFTGYISDFMLNHTSYHDHRVFFTNMYSNQTHIDIDGDLFLRTFNLMLKLNFAGGLLFSNSLPNAETLPSGLKYPDGTLCARDFNWKYSEFPATGCFDSEFQTLDELAEDLAEQELFLKKDPMTGNVTATGKVSIRQYFEDPDKQEEDLRLFRMFANISLNHYHTLELRSDCIQPLADTFLPNAFYLGLVSNLTEAEILTGHFFTANQITYSNSQLREMAVTGQQIANDAVLKEFLYELLETSIKGLIDRGYGEERYLEPLTQRINTLSCPALVMKKRLADGDNLMDLIHEWGSIREDI